MTHEGMVSADEWAETSIHRASTYYCGKCGKPFATPQDLYEHLTGCSVEARVQLAGVVNGGRKVWPCKDCRVPHHVDLLSNDQLCRHCIAEREARR